MAQRYKIVGSVANGTYSVLSTDIKMSADYQTGTFIIAFYDDSGNAVTPTAGTIKPEMSPIAGQWHEPSSGDVTIDATKVIAGVATYVMPVFFGAAVDARLTLSGITGLATNFEAHFWRVG